MDRRREFAGRGVRVGGLERDGLLGRREGFVPEGPGDLDGPFGETIEIFRGAGPLAEPLAKLAIEGEEFREQRPAVAVQGPGQGRLDLGPVTRPPFGLEPLAGLVDAPGLREGEGPFRLDPMASHRGNSGTSGLCPLNSDLRDDFRD